MDKTIQEIYDRTDFDQFRKIKEGGDAVQNRYVIDMIDTIIEEEIQ